MIVRKLAYALLALALLAVFSPALRADTLTASLVTDTLSATPGGSVTFQANISNPSATDTFLNSDTFATSSLLLTVDDTPFFANSPLSLASGSSFGPFDIFTVFLDPSIAPGTYTGTFSILGGVDGLDFTDLADLSFTVNVPSSTAVPEPATLPMLLFGASLAAALSLTRKR